MTAVAALYEDFLPLDAPLTEALIEQLPEHALASLLLRRFRVFLARGDRESLALLLAVGYTRAQAAFAVEALAAEPRILH